MLKNAIAYSDPDSTIQIAAEKKESDIHLHLSNAGKTIPVGKLQNIFRKFYRLDESRSTGSGGAGLGLAIAKEIVGLHNGKISAASQDRITAFHIILPTKNN